MVFFLSLFSRQLLCILLRSGQFLRARYLDIFVGLRDGHDIVNFDKRSHDVEFCMIVIHGLKFIYKFMLLD